LRGLGRFRDGDAKWFDATECRQAARSERERPEEILIGAWNGIGVVALAINPRQGRFIVELPSGREKSTLLTIEFQLGKL
jgi:hypothetical protein